MRLSGGFRLRKARQKASKVEQRVQVSEHASTLVKGHKQGAARRSSLVSCYSCYADTTA